jgi:transcriptional regulator GlxA family with amidase domain
MSQTASRRIAIAVFPGIQSLDAVGPYEVFDAAGRIAGTTLYEVVLVARERGPLAASSGLAVVAQAAWAELKGPLDTLIVAGGQGVRAACDDPEFLGFLREATRLASRVASVCTGAFALARLGVLDGRPATTHWGACRRLAADYPRVEVRPDAIFVDDGDVLTSAGVTAGMDLALHLVERDHGAALALAVARQLVLFLKRPGGQAQFSAELAAQTAGVGPVGRAQAWALANLGAELDVTALAEAAGLSPRQFARRFRAETGQTPAKFVERARVEAARRRLEAGAQSVKVVAAACGFGTVEHMRRSFVRLLGVSPDSYRARFRPARGGAPEERRGGVLQ